MSHWETEPERRSELVRLLHWARPYTLLLLLALLLGLAASAADITRAWLVKPVVDDVVLPHGALAAPTLEGWLPGGAPEPALGAAERAAVEARVRDNLLRVVLLFAGLAVLLPLLEMLRELASSWALGRVRVDMQRDACAALLALPLREHRRGRRGDLVTRAVHDVDSAQSGVEALFASFLPALVHVGVGGIFLLAISWRLSLLALLGGPLLFWILSGFGRRVRRSALRRQEQVAVSSQRLLEILSGIQVIKAFRAESAEQEAFRRESARLFRRSMRVVRERLASRALVDFVNQGLTVGGLALGAWMLVRGAWGLTPGDLVAFFLVANQSYQPLKRLAHAHTALTAARAGASRVLALIDAPRESPDPPGALRPAAQPHRLEVRGLHFAHGDRPVLRDVSFTLEPGETVALVGRSGAGKSTLADLLLRLHEPDAGCIEVDGIDLRRLGRDAWLARTAVVTQEPFLFDTTVRENIRYGRAEASDEAVLAAGRAARVDALVRSLPEGYDTEVGASGLRLSGGERQRIAIARALLRDPGLLVLDEATSALDARSEKALQQAIEALLGGRRTTLVIAHRLSTIRRADRILVLEDGRISQQGTHEELVQRGGLYAELASLQAGKETPS
ncbi:MAG: ABC transporter ATP-binding protein [Myxococcota bacterium]|nr:ABC transporter ATP-binding protein [Myxococcota bacterium]